MVIHNNVACDKCDTASSVVAYSSSSMSLELQQLVLDILDKESEIKDTRTIILPGESKSAASQDAQLLIQGALNSLLSREVGMSFFEPIRDPWIKPQ
jgi:hypothetical protein